MRHLTRAAASVLLLGSCRREEPMEESLPPVEIVFLHDALLPQGETLDRLEVGGLSSLSYSGAAERWLALSDAHVPARLFEIQVDTDGSSLHVAVKTAVVLEDGGTLDTEGLARAPWGNLLVSTEGGSRSEPVLQPKLLELDPQGALKRSIPIPEKFEISGWPPTRGVRNNLAFEGLALSPDGSRLFLGTEGTLHQDGPKASFESAGYSRIIVYRIVGRELTAHREYVYPIGPFTRIPELGEQEVDGGLVDLVALGNERLLVLERIFVREISGERRDTTRVRIYEADLAEATDVSAIDSLAASSDWRPVTKELVLDLDDILSELSAEYPRLDNLEGMALGPELPGGGRALLLVSDDNFRVKQRTQFLLFRLKGA